MDTLIPIDALPQMYGRDARTIRRWIRRDNIRVIYATNGASRGRKAVWQSDLWRFWGAGTGQPVTKGTPFTIAELHRSVRSHRDASE